MIVYMSLNTLYLVSVIFVADNYTKVKDYDKVL